MIPQFDVPTTVEVNFKQLYVPTKRVLHVKDGLMSNHDYVYLGPVSWKRFTEVFESEGSAIEEIDSKTATHDDFERVAEEIDEELRLAEFIDAGGVDLGVISPVFALYAFKCYPITSCRGHPGHVGDTQDCPKVVFFAPPDKGPLLVQAALKTGVGLVNDVMPEGGGLLVNGRNLMDMRNFSWELYRVSSTMPLRRRAVS